jgi:uncharacterized protein (DUF934 family)
MPRRLLRDGGIVLDDWQYLEEAGESAAAANAATALILPFERWINEREVWIARAPRLGVVLGPAHNVERLAADLYRLDLIGAAFTSPAEGRGYTQARLLRERWHFSGELRATGQVRRDQVFFLARCGFNSFELPEGELEEARHALFTFSAAYQPSNDSGIPVPLRHR